MLAISVITTVKAASVAGFLVYDSTTEKSLTINDGDDVGIAVIADSIFENSMTIDVKLLDSSGNVVANLLHDSTKKDSYSKHLTFGKSAYINPGSYSIKLVVTAKSGSKDLDQLFLEVLPMNPNNNAPVIISTAPTEDINEGTFFSYQVTATDADNDSLTYSLAQNPSWISINSNGLITGTAPFLDDDYQYAVTVEVSDGTDFDSQFFTIKVIDSQNSPVNNVPVITSSPATSVNENSQYTYQVDATDADNDSLTYSLQGPSWLSIDSNGLVTGTTPSVNSDKTYPVKIEVSDGKDSTEQTYTLIVLNVPNGSNDTIPPIVNIDYPNNGTTYNSHVTSLTFSASDQNLNSCWYTTDNGVTNTTVTCNSPINVTSVEGSNTWTVYADDVAGNVGSDSVTFNVDTSGGGGNGGGGNGKKHKNDDNTKNLVPINPDKLADDFYEKKETVKPYLLEEEEAETEVVDGKDSIKRALIVLLLMLILLLIVLIFLVLANRFYL